MGNWQKGRRERERQGEGGGRGGGDKGVRKHSGEDRKPLDGEDGKFGECGPIFNSGCQATDEQQAGEKRDGEGPHWVTGGPTCGIDSPRKGRASRGGSRSTLTSLI